MKKIDFKNIDWKSAGSLINPRSLDNANIFLEKLPQNTNKCSLIIVAVIWGFTAALGLYTTIKIQEAAELSVELDEAKALSPIVPKIQDKPVPTREVTAFVDELQGIYKGLEIKGNSSNIVVFSRSTAQFGQFREAIGHIQNGGLGWRVNVEKLCVGKECKPNPLAASLKIYKVSVEKVSGN